MEIDSKQICLNNKDVQLARIAQKVRQIDQNHVDRIQQISDTNNHDITSPLEGMTLRNDKIQGGSGFAAATVADLGFEPTDGASHTASGSGMSGGKRGKAKAKTGAGVSGGALLTDKDASAVLRPQTPNGMEARITLAAPTHKNQPIPQTTQGTTIKQYLKNIFPSPHIPILYLHMQRNVKDLK